MKIFEMNDCGWWIANSTEEAATAYCELYGTREGEDIRADGPRELTESELDSLIFSDDLSDPNASKRTFREELARRLPVSGPEPFASTEY